MEQEVFYELDENGNILKQMTEEEGQSIHKSLQQFDDESPLKRGLKNISAGKRPHNSKACDTPVEEEEEGNKLEIDEQRGEELDSKGNVFVFDKKSGQKIKKKVVIQEVKRVRKNSKGEEEEFVEQIENVIYSPLSNNNNNYSNKFSSRRINSKGESTDRMPRKFFEEIVSTNRSGPEHLPISLKDKVVVDADGQKVLKLQTTVVKKRRDSNG